MKPGGNGHATSPKGKSSGLIRLVVEILILIFAILTFLYTIGVLKFPKIFVSSHDTIELKQVDNKLVFVNFLSMGNSWNGMGYINKFDAQLVHKCDNMLIASFNADSTRSNGVYDQFIPIGLKGEEQPRGVALVFYQIDNSVSMLRPGEIYQLSISYYTPTKIPFLFGDSKQITTSRIFSLTESQIKKLTNMDKNSTRNKKAILIALCKI